MKEIAKKINTNNSVNFCNRNYKSNVRFLKKYIDNRMR